MCRYTQILSVRKGLHIGQRWPAWRRKGLEQAQLASISRLPVAIEVQNRGEAATIASVAAPCVAGVVAVADVARAPARIARHHSVGPSSDALQLLEPRLELINESIHAEKVGGQRALAPQLGLFAVKPADKACTMSWRRSFRPRAAMP